MNKGNLLLLLAAAIWGFSLVSQSAGMEVMGPWSFTAVRCTMAGLAMIPLVCYSEKKKIKENSEYSWKFDTKMTVIPALWCFLFLGGNIMCQQIGLLYTSVGKGAFITAFYIFLTPVTGMFFGKRVTGRTWVAVVLATAGLYLITMTGGFSGLNRGDVLMLGAAFFYTFFIHAAGRYAKVDTVKLSCMQFLLIGLIAFVPAFIFEPGDITWANMVTSAAPILYAGLVSGAGGYTIQMIGQKYTDTNSASIVLSSETVFSLFAGWLCFHEILRPVEYAGCAIMVVAIAIAVVQKKPVEKEND